MDTMHPRGGRWAASVALAGAVLLSAWAGPAGAAERRVALVIGNAGYHDPDAVLSNPGHDADAMAAALGRLGFEVVKGKDLDRDGFYDTLDEFAAAARGADVALFFYAGHGVQVDEKNWLVPVDARLESRRDLERRAVKLDTVMDEMQGRSNLVFLDACRNNPLARGLARAMGVSRAAEAATRGLARVEKGRGRFIGYATAPDDVAADGDGDNSPFTKALLAHIENPKWSVPDMFGKVVESVVDATGGAQEPWQTSSLRGDPIYLASAAAPPPPPKDKDTATSTVGGTPPPSGDAAKAAYEAAKEVGNVDAYRIVVKRFPGTLEAELAQAQIAKLEKEQPPPVVPGGDPVDDVPPPAPALSPEAVERNLELSREDRRLVQMGLAAAGHDPGPADGMIGRGAREAIRRWQGGRGEPATGFLDADGAKALMGLGRGRAEAKRKAREAEQRRRAEAERRRAEAERERKAREAKERRKRARRPGTTFEDCPECPEMVVVPSGSFMMGSPESEPGRSDIEGPVHPVTIARPFAVGVYEVTFAEWDACVSGGGCGGFRPDDEGWGRGSRPVINVSWNDAQRYVQWLSRKTGAKYRLLSEAEWEYVARAGTTTAYWWGDDIGRNNANCLGCWSRWDARGTAPVGSFSANSFGLHDVHGNVWEWTEDCYEGDCSRRVLRGGSWFLIPRILRSAFRLWLTTGIRGRYLGFRVARTLTP